MADRGPSSVSTPGDLRAQLKQRLSALKGELERLRFETDRRWDELLARLTDRPEEIVPEELLRPAPPPAPPREALGGIASETVRRLDSAGRQVEALTLFLEECRRHASRAALLVERRGRFEVWKAAGFAAHTGPVAVEGDPALDQVRAGIPQRLGRRNAISAALGAEDASDAVLVPFVVREKVSGAVYADVPAGSESDRLDTDAVATLTWIAGLVVDRLSRRKLVPSPALRGIERAREEPSPESPLPREEATAGSGERPLAGPLAPRREDERRDDARRFARLLASEIKLYNELEVEEGRARGDLYVRLRGDIERGRRLYEERVPADIRSGSNYYYEELLDVLAGGRPEALK